LDSSGASTIFLARSFHPLVVGCRHLRALDSLELVVDDRVLLRAPFLRGFGLDVLDPPLDRLEALLTVLFVLRVEGVRRV